jgi:hypothetical protein
VHLPTTSHWVGKVQAVFGGLRLFVHTPTLSQNALLGHARPNFGDRGLVHFAAAPVHAAVALQAAPPLEQTPVFGQSTAGFAQLVAAALLHLAPIAGHEAAVVHAALGGLLHTPLFGTTGHDGLFAWLGVQAVATVVAQWPPIAGHVPGLTVQTAFGGLLQFPADGQLLTPALIVQAPPVLLHVPPVLGQSVLTLQEPLLAPAQRFRLQFAFVVQLLPATLHVPLMKGHWLLSVHCVLVCTLQLP